MCKPVASRTVRTAGLAWAWAILICLHPVAAQAEAQPTVLFFGGVGSNAVDMRAWTTAARQDPHYGRLFAFEAVPYPLDPGGGEHTNAALARAMVRRLAGALNATPGRRVTLVGHSSGVNLAAAVLAKLRHGEAVRLIALDGIPEQPLIAPPGFRFGVQFECWSATAGDLESSRQKETRASCARYHALRAPKCRTAGCLHFSLVNKNAPLALEFREVRQLDRNGATKPYWNLQINLDWLQGVR